MHMHVQRDAQGRCIITVTAQTFGAATERRLRRSAQIRAREEGFVRIRKIDRQVTPRGVLLEYVAYRPISLDQAPQEESSTPE